MMDFMWKDGFRTQGVDIEKAGAVLTRIVSRDGVVTPDAVVKAARRKSSPIHGWFEWDDTVAAKQYRLTQARKLIQAVGVKYILGDDEERVVRAFVHIGDDSNYEPIHSVLTVESRRGRLLAKALAELESFRRKYATLEELADVYAAIDATKRKAS